MTDAANPPMTFVEDLASLITVAPESTVSRTVLRAEGTRVVLFGFDTGQQLTEHTAAVPVVLQALEGRMNIGADGDLVELVPGGVVHLGTRVPHTVEALEPSKLALTMLDPRQGRTAEPLEAPAKRSVE